MKKLFLFLIIAFCLCKTQDSQAYVLKIYKTFLSHDPGGALRDYNYADRREIIEYEPLCTTQIKSKTVHIFCEGNGTVSCPSSIVAPSDKAMPPDFMTLSAINSAQVILDAQVSAYENEGIRRDVTGSVRTEDGLLYHYSVIWTTEVATGEVNLEFVFASSPL